MTPKTLKKYWLPALIHQVCVMQDAWVKRECATIYMIAKSESDYDPQNLEKNIGLLLDTTEMYLAGSVGPRGDNTQIKRVKENERINDYLKTIYCLD